nr:RNA polymerase sigma-70 factor [Chryseosolibacter histidini]
MLTKPALPGSGAHLTCSQNVEQDLHLIEQIKKGNRVAFNALYLRYWEELYRFGYGILGDEDQAKDILQDIFFAIWRNREALEIRSVSAYLHTAVRYEVTRALRNGKLTASHEECLSALPSPHSSEAHLHLADLEDQVKETLEKLPQKSREVFYLSRFQELSNKEIAQKLSLSQRTVEWHISSALQHLRQSMNHLATWVVLTISPFL